MKKLINKKVFITGASAGIGKACATAFANEGANLLLAARRTEKLSELAEELKKKYDVKIKTIKLDVRINEEVEQTLSSLDDDWKNIDILINNAGLARGFDKIYSGKIEDWEEVIKVRFEYFKKIKPVDTVMQVTRFINLHHIHFQCL